MSCDRHHASRRTLLRSGAALFTWAYLPKLARAATGGRDPRFVAIVLRGALDGLSAVAPVGDPDYAGLHGPLALSTAGDRAALPLDGFFALNPGMPVFASLYAQGQAAVVHAVATPYRDRSHFDGQDVLESGLAGPGATDSGWLNRLLGILPKGERVEGVGGLAVGTTTPLIIRGAAPVLGWAPSIVPDAGEALAARVLALYRRTDPALAAALAEGLAVARLTDAEGGVGRGGRGGGMDKPRGMMAAAEGAGRLLAAADGPRVAALAFDGWDTHVNEGGASGRLAQLLGGLDSAIGALRGTLGPAWTDTAVVVMTEFGRTVHINGTVGTDHGTGTVAFLAGGAIRGGRVIADWPGLKPAQLHEARDLRPTTDLRSVLKGLVTDHLGVPGTLSDMIVFPGSAAVKPDSSLIA